MEERYPGSTDFQDPSWGVGHGLRERKGKESGGRHLGSVMEEEQQ